MREIGPARQKVEESQVQLGGLDLSQQPRDNHEGSEYPSRDLFALKRAQAVGRVIQIGGFNLEQHAAKNSDKAGEQYEKARRESELN